MNIASVRLPRDIEIYEPERNCVAEEEKPRDFGVQGGRLVALSEQRGNTRADVIKSLFVFENRTGNGVLFQTP